MVQKNKTEIVLRDAEFVILSENRKYVVIFQFASLFGNSFKFASLVFSGPKKRTQTGIYGKKKHPKNLLR